MATEPILQVRAPQRVHDEFEELVRKAQARMQYGTLKRGEVLDIVVTSATAAIAAGHWPPPVPKASEDG